MGSLPLVRRMQAQWKLSRALGVANLLVLHRLSDLDAAGGAGSEIRAVADGLLADCATRIIYRQETDQLGPTATALGLTGPERELLPALPRGTGLWKLPGGRAHVVHHRPAPARDRRGRHRHRHDAAIALGRGGRVSAGEPLARAEAATLGAVLLDPASLDRVRWLRGRDFTDPWHGLVFDLLRETSHAQPPLDPAAFGRALLDRHGPHRADLPRLVDLLTATPPRPQLEVYARMVLDASIRRDVASQGVLLRAGALQAALTGTAHPVTATTALVHAALDAGENRWNRATGASPGDPRPATPAALAPALRHPAPALNADRLLSAHPALDPGQVAEHERDLIAALVSHPAAAAELAGWLRPEHLLDRDWAAVYAAVLDLTDTAQPVDEVTVGWRIARSARRLGPGPDPHTLHAAVEQTLTADPRWLARRVAGDHVRRTAEHAATGLQTAAANPGLDVVDVLGTGHLHTDAVHGAAAGLPATAPRTEQRHLSPVPTLATGHDADRPGRGGPVSPSPRRPRVRPARPAAGAGPRGGGRLGARRRRGRVRGGRGAVVRRRRGLPGHRTSRPAGRAVAGAGRAGSPR